jgi:excisionase family DNA binding protein
MLSNLDDAMRALLKSVVLEALRTLPRPRQEEAIRNPDEAILLRPKEAAKLLAMSDRNLSRLAKAGRIPCVRIDRLVRYDLQALRQWVKNAIPPATCSSAELPPPTSRKPRQPPRRANPVSTANQKSLRAAANRPAQDRRTNRPINRFSKTRSQLGSEPRTAREFFAAKLGLNSDALPEITHGELMRIAEVDHVTWHAWVYRGGELPDTAIAKLEAHFRSLQRGS